MQSREPYAPWITDPDPLEEPMSPEQLQKLAEGAARGHMHCTSPCPLYPQKQTCALHYPMSALGQKRTCLYYSITSSAVNRSFGGMVKPSALAVLRLMTRSYLVGCS